MSECRVKLQFSKKITFTKEVYLTQHEWDVLSKANNASSIYPKGGIEMEDQPYYVLSRYEDMEDAITDDEYTDFIITSAQLF